MTNLEEILVKIESLPEEDFSKLRKWIIERDWEQWDKEILQDVEKQKLDSLIDEAKKEKDSDSLRSL
jgi:hypothetical protein